MTRVSTFVLALCLALSLAGSASAQTAPAVPNDPHWGAQWGPRQVNADDAWALSTGAGAVIAVVDTGVDLDHPDLAAKMVPGATFVGCADNGPCGNGDWESALAKGENPHPHGTHVAGIAAAVTDNGTGIAGVARDASIMPIKVLAEDGGSFQEIAAGIRWATDNGADVVNMSLGALPGVQALEVTGLISATTEAIDYANSKGVVVVVAAGNEAAPLCASPSFNDGALCVTSTDRNEAKAWYSNLGVKPDLLAVAAPGGQGLISCAQDIISTVPFGAEGFCGRSTAGYDAYAGTSMATPHVGGVAALLTAQGRSNAEVYDVLTATARTPVTGLRGVYSPSYGFGIVDAAAAVATPVTTAPSTDSGEQGTGNGGNTDEEKPNNGKKPDKATRRR